MTEDQEQMRVVEWCRTSDWKRSNAGLPEYGLGLIFHISNGGWRSKSEAARLKAMGVKAGVSDLFLPIPVGELHGLWIEMKAPAGETTKAGTVSKEQSKWLEMMELSGYGAAVAFGADEAISIIKEYMGMEDESNAAA